MTNIVLQGRLFFLGLGELLQLFGNAGSTGIIKLKSPHTHSPGFIYVLDGNPIDAEFEDQNGQDVLNSFFGWLDAEFEFSDEKILRRKMIQKNRMEIILDGLRLLDDGLIETVGEVSPKKSRIDNKDASGIPIIKGPLVDYLYIVDEDEFVEGQEIVVQEKFGNWLWVILEGVVEIVRSLPEGKAVINKLTEGAFIGSINSMREKKNVRSATVTAISHVQLGVLDYHRILEEFSKISAPFRNVIFSIEDRLNRVTTLCASIDLKKSNIYPPIDGLKPFKFMEKSDETIFSIQSGTAVVIKPFKKKYLPLCQLNPGDFIGNVSFLDTSHEPHSAQVLVSEDFQTEEIDLIDLKEEYDELSATLKNMILHTSTCLTVTTARLMDIVKKTNFES